VTFPRENLRDSEVTAICSVCGHPEHGEAWCPVALFERFPVDVESGEAEMLCSCRCLCGTPREAERQAALRRAFEDGLACFSSVRIFVRRHPGVVVPEHVADQHWRSCGYLCLEYGLDMPVPVEGLVVDELGVRAVLSFDRMSHETLVPWAAVVAVASGEPPPEIVQKRRRLRSV
jgi:hypothetical protein